MRVVTLLVVLSAGAALADTYPSTVADPLPVPVTVQAADGGVPVLQVEGRGGGPLVAEVTGPGSGAVNGSMVCSLELDCITAASESTACMADVATGDDVHVTITASSCATLPLGVASIWMQLRP